MFRTDLSFAAVVVMTVAGMGVCHLPMTVPGMVIAIPVWLA